MNDHHYKLGKPKLRKILFWDFIYDKIDWHASYRTIIERVLERGTRDEWQELINFYTRDKVVHTIQSELSYLTDDIIDQACQFFDLKKEELKCYIRKQSLPRHWF